MFLCAVIHQKQTMEMALRFICIMVGNCHNTYNMTPLRKPQQTPREERFPGVQGPRPLETVVVETAPRSNPLPLCASATWSDGSLFKSLFTFSGKSAVLRAPVFKTSLTEAWGSLTLRGELNALFGTSWRCANDNRLVSDSKFSLFPFLKSVG